MVNRELANRLVRDHYLYCHRPLCFSTLDNIPGLNKHPYLLLDAALKLNLYWMHCLLDAYWNIDGSSEPQWHPISMAIVNRGTETHSCIHFTCHIWSISDKHGQQVAEYFYDNLIAHGEKVDFGRWWYCTLRYLRKRSRRNFAMSVLFPMSMIY